MRHRRLHRTVFAAAGIYNLAWGSWIALHPTSFYIAAAIPVPRHPEVAGVLGMVVGLYGLLYLEVARRPEHGWLIAAVGLLGKIAGPAALAWHIAAGTWPPDGLVIIAFNDLIWWAPFAAYLLHAWPYVKAGSDPPPPVDRPLTATPRQHAASGGRPAGHHPIAVASASGCSRTKPTLMQVPTSSKVRPWSAADSHTSR